MFLRRVRRLFLLLSLPFLAVAARLCHLQVVNGTGPREAGAGVSTERVWLDAARGRILDRRGRELARDEIGFDLCVDYLYIHCDGDRLKREVRKRVPSAERKNPEAVAAAQRRFLAEIEASWDRLAELTGRPREELERGRAAVRKVVERTRARVRASKGGAEIDLAEDFQAHMVLTGLTKEAAMAVAAAEPRPAGIEIRHTRNRAYPFGSRACHVIGNVGPVGDRELKDALSESNLSGYAAKDRTGRGGVEQSAEEHLRGARGLLIRPKGRPDAEPIRTVPARPGADVRLTLDIELQAAVEDLLDRRGAIVVIDVADGGVLAMAGFPRYDLNTFRDEFEDLRDDPQLPLINRCVSPYAPGSTVKPVIGLAALESGAVGEHTCLNCSGAWAGGGGNFACWLWRTNRSAHGPLNLSRALRVSCNHYFFHAAQSMGGPALEDWAGRFGLGKPTGVGLPGESGGRVPDAAFFRRQRGPDGPVWTSADERLTAIGQGAFTATPLQIADVAATLARGGVRIRPHLWADLSPEREPLGASRGHVRAVNQGLREVVGHHEGLAHKTAWMADLPIAGKTGSAQVWARIDGEVRPADPHCWFMGYAPADQPRVAFAIMLENVPGGSGGLHAAPFAKAVAKLCREHGYLDGPASVQRTRGTLAAPRRGGRE